jgi:hypothetical protein
MGDSCVMQKSPAEDVLQELVQLHPSSSDKLRLRSSIATVLRHETRDAAVSPGFLDIVSKYYYHNDGLTAAMIAKTSL